ncbi:hypothetical protein ILUMI_22778 [Ignelater luminosus]|uniref:Uncharacterized protein n=1 Tax=Ignelater luminosus TaxID=2038154 RepID=A0A8K0CGG2_IGNLU|nr:hypothetical protein ILUMI_22778 [Ignelater luminosus]
MESSECRLFAGACPLTHWVRIRQHERISNRLETLTQKRNAVVDHQEPHIRFADGSLRKPDLIFINPERAIKKLKSLWPDAIDLLLQPETRTDEDEVYEDKVVENEVDDDEHDLFWDLDDAMNTKEKEGNVFCYPSYLLLLFSVVERKTISDRLATSERLVHQEEYNAEMEAKTQFKTRPWSRLEILDLINADLDYSRKARNRDLATKFNRTREEAGSDVEPEPATHSSILNPQPGTSLNMSPKIFSHNLSTENSNSSPAPVFIDNDTIPPRLQQDLEVFPQSFNIFLRECLNKDELTLEDKDLGQAAERGFKYKRMQNLYHKDKGRLTNTVIDNLDSMPKGFPSVESIETTYSNLFGPAENIDDSPVTIKQEVGNLSLDIYQLITKEELQKTLAKTRSSAAGPDKITISLIRRLPLDRLLLKLLIYADKLIRQAVKRISHCRVTIPNAFIHAPLREGGLSICSLLDSVPAILLQRLNNLAAIRDHAAIESTFGSGWGQALFERFERLFLRNGHSTKEVRTHWSTSLQNSTSGNGLKQGSTSQYRSIGLSDPPKYWSGRDYIKALQLRANVLPTVGTPYNRGEAARCRAGCDRVESLSHVLQGYPSIHWPRIRRHDHLAKIVADAARNQGWAVKVEPNI